MNSESAKYRFEYALVIKESKDYEDVKIESGLTKKEILISNCEKQLWRKYRNLVWKITERQSLRKLENYEKRSFLGYHLDHKVSIWYGYKNKIDPYLIGSIHNLEFIPHKENLKKSIKCNFKGTRAIQTVMYI